MDRLSFLFLPAGTFAGESYNMSLLIKQGTLQVVGVCHNTPLIFPNGFENTVCVKRAMLVRGSRHYCGKLHEKNSRPGLRKCQVFRNTQKTASKVPTTCMSWIRMFG